MPTVTSLNGADYGMVAGTGTDQTANFQAAINAAQTQGLPLFIPAGSYSITTVNITAPIEIYSAAGNAVIQGYQRSPTINVAPSGSAASFGPVYLHDLTVTGQFQSYPAGLTNPALISVTNVSGAAIERCSLLQSGSHGIYLDQCTGGVIKDCTVSQPAQFGIYSVDNNGGLLIDNNRVLYAGNNGIYIQRSSASGDQSIISNNLIGFTSANAGGTGPYGNGVIVYLSDFVKVQGNMIYSSAFSAIRFNGSSFAEVTGNQCYSSSEVAIRIEAAQSNTPFFGGIVANNIVDTAGTGISISNSNNGARETIITGNQVYSCSNNSFPGYQTWGTGIWAEADVVVNDNIVDNCADWGIVIYPTNNGSLGTQKISAQAMNNTIKNCSGGIGFYQADTTYGRAFVGGNVVNGFTTTAKYAAIVPITYNGATGEVKKVTGTPDLGNATTSGFANVKLLLNYSFT
ncbi:MAG: TIGR03808 family TAT-translocated repetitive protein [Pseudomonadota bacterium]